MMDKKILWRAVHAGFLVCIGLFGIGNFLGIASLQFWHVLTAFAVLFLLSVFWNMSLRGRLLSLSVMVIVLFGTSVVMQGESILTFCHSYFDWLLDSPLQYPEWVMGYELVQTAFLALFCYLAQMIMERDYRFGTAKILIIFLALLYCLFARKELSHVGVAFMLCYTALLLVEWTQRHWKKEKEKSMQAYMLWLMPFFIVYFCLMLLPDVPQKPYDWQIVRSVYDQLKESFLKFSSNYLRGDGEDYDLSLSGFSERGRLEGENQENQQEIMTVESSHNPVASLYLTGKVYDTFDGRQWEAQSKETSRTRYLDTAETLSAVQSYDRQYVTDYLANPDIKIRYRYFRSAYVFAPLKTRKLGEGIAELDFNEIGGSLYFDGKKGYGTEYDVSFYQLNTGQDVFWQFLAEASAKNSETEEADSRDAALSEVLYGMTKERIGIEEIQRYRRKIYEDYLSDVILTKEVESYLEEITEGAETDVEKLRAIEKELASFTYTRIPGELPMTVNSSGEFLDYFLLESREGYCAYFATAFVLLARAEGLPARYVQGFCVPVRSGEEIMVYSDMAHAWPEVYFEGVGWIPFEPTPGYSEMRYTSWGMRKDRTDSIEEADTAKEQERKATLELPEEENEQKMQEDFEKGDGRKRFLQLFVLIGVWTFFAILFIFLWNRQLVRFCYRKMEQTQKFTVEVNQNLRILALLGIRRGAEETFAEFQNRAGAILGGENALLFLQSYEDFLYGDKNVIPLMLEETKRQQEELKKILKKRKKWAYIYYCIVFL